MKKTVFINGQEVEVDIHSMDNNNISFDYLGKPFYFELCDNSDGQYILKESSNKIHRVLSPSPNIFISKGQSYEVQKKSYQGNSNIKVSSGDLISPLPGKVIKVLKSNGDDILAGDDIIIIEAMKMEHRICAEVDGVLSAVTIKEGDTVQEGLLLGKIS